ncbi:serine/threonine-protein kinase [Nonomuraea typhae]|uniref:serine/threonine-protein kinase n=1 Tax=Nonomuraea typhae TaxID=2603600 RepID=UPI0012FCDFC8|nr:serine/threonine-protein kinase [Nonomuraea typhae]
MTTCTQPGCTGTIEDGYCDLAGHKAEAPASTPLTGPMTTPTSTPLSGPVSRPTSGRLADALEDLPPVPTVDPDDVVLKDPQVAESKRYCTNPGCLKPVGRGRDGRPGRADGFCPHCRTRFSFSPKLAKDDLVGGQYRVRGAMAHGGLGWIYMATDENLDGKPVVLKGLLNTSDPDALAAAEAERRFLISVDHPNIVDIINFQQHDGLSYIVMEFVGGQSLHQLRRQGLLPLRDTLKYGREILRAFGYLHEQGLVYCDLKPANAIRVGKRLKLIDLGAVQRIGSPPGTSWVTVGYHAPELDTVAASVTSDLYTVARTLAVLAVPNFSPARDGKENPLPADCGHESFTRLLRRATDREPGARFQSSAEMEEQLTGVLREISAAAEGKPFPNVSGLFGPERLAAGAALSADQSRVFAPLDPLQVAAALPVPLADPADPAAGALAGLAGRSPQELLAQVEAMPKTTESALTRIRLLAESAHPETGRALADAAGHLGGDWRLTWYQGVHALTSGRPADAVQHFDACFSFWPGEPAAKLALGLALEAAGQDAGRWYDTVWRTDRAFVSAAFGLARHHLAGGDGAGATGVLDQVPASSSHRVAAQLACVAVHARGGGADAPALAAAADRLEALADLDQSRRDGMKAEVFSAALGCIAQKGPAAGVKLGAVPFTDAGVRGQLEEIYRRLARAAATRQERHALVDRANAVRLRTWV